MLRNVYEVKEEVGVDDKEYDTLVKQGFIVEKYVIDKEGFLSIMVDDARLADLLKIRKATK